MNYAERCRERAKDRRLIALIMSTAQSADAALLEAAAGLYEAANQEHGGTDGEPLECPICNALTAADAAAKGAE